ncbi:YajQ family cyclic di-GMP-binding protein [Adlercreutzia sp. ZJ304]|uniref:YajQ family cyclic di-GMP-binding protein n=1 Tax=Adlercreutzia sp. ZJ304 TaxID=2709791 RepID=UPI0013EC60B8|nr:YajQ family cyclic di-GMP-binding protein [Adlercreutzia sp. ZJ304]
MAKENSFDVVSLVDMQEVDNAFQQAKKELSQRYDLKDSGSKIELDKQKHEMLVEAPSDFVANQVIDIVSSKLVKRGIDLGAVKWGEVQSISGGNVSRKGNIISGIDKDTLTKINKDLKALKLKIKTQIEGDKLRVTSASRDTLQDVIAHLKSEDFGQPLQFVNYR